MGPTIFHGNIHVYFFSHSMWTWEYSRLLCGLLSFPLNIVMDLNNVMQVIWEGEVLLYHKQNVIYQNITFMINNDFFFELWTCTIGAHTKLVSKWKVFQIFPSAWEHEIFLGLLHGVGLGVALGYIYITIFPFPIFDANTCWRWSHFHYIIILLYIPFFVCCLIIYIFFGQGET